MGDQEERDYITLSLLGMELKEELTPSENIIRVPVIKKLQTLHQYLAYLYRFPNAFYAELEFTAQYSLIQFFIQNIDSQQVQTRDDNICREYLSSCRVLIRRISDRLYHPPNVSTIR